MNHYAYLLILIIALFASPAIAGSGHDHGHSHAHEAISSDKAISLAAKKIQQLVESGKISASWAKINTDQAEKKTFSHDPSWLVAFKNDKISDASKQTLYVFLSMEGHYIAANYTGQYSQA